MPAAVQSQGPKAAENKPLGPLKPSAGPAESLPVAADEEGAQAVVSKAPAAAKGKGRAQKTPEEAKAEADQKAKDERARIQDVADLASSVQPTGDTLATANVHAEVLASRLLSPTISDFQFPLQ